MAIDPFAGAFSNTGDTKSELQNARSHLIHSRIVVAGSTRIGQQPCQRPMLYSHNI